MSSHLSQSNIPFAKLHGLGNDFVLLDMRRIKATSPSKFQITKGQIQKMANRKTGVGFDQLIVLEKAKAETSMKSKGGAVPIAAVVFYNADGSRAEMCGNGLRAAALYCFLELGPEHSRFKLQSDTGMHECEVIEGKGVRATIRCTTGLRHIEPKPLPKALSVFLKKLVGIDVGGAFVDVGNPHVVLFYTPKSKAELTRVGEAVENHPLFPARTNVQFVELKNAKKNQISVSIWERGVGITEACGTGAVACGISASLKWNLKWPVSVQSAGGVAKACLLDHQIWLEGEAALVFTGVWVTA